MSTARRWISLARPRGAAIVALFPVVGLGLGLWERGSQVAPWVIGPHLLLLYAAWLFLHAGSMWLNAVLDRDEGPVLLGEAGPVPEGTSAAGYLALVVSVALTLPLGRVTTVCAAICAVLAVLYSHPRIALKGSAWGGPLVNGLGYGVLSPLAGHAVSETPPSWRTLLACALGALLILTVYFSAQAFQEAEDRDRGYRTLVATHGSRAVLSAARFSLGLAFGVACGAATIGVFPRAVLVAVPLWFVADRYLVRWRDRVEGGDGRDGNQFVVRLALGALIVVGATYVDHFVAMAMGTPLGGCGTAIVPAVLEGVCGG